MDSPTKFTGMTDEAIGVYLNVDGNIEGLISSEISWLLFNKQNVVNLIDFNHLDNFNNKLSNTDLSKDLTQSQTISVINDPVLNKIEKVDPADASIKLKLDLSSLSAAIANSASAPGGATALLASANFINEIIGIVSVLDLITNDVPKIPTLVASFSQNLNTMFSDFYSNIKNMSSGLQGAPSDLANSTDPGFGFSNSLGGTNNSGSLLEHGGSQAPADAKNTSVSTSIVTTPDTTSYKRLDAVLTRTIGQDWKAKNSKPGNPLILEAYAISGRNYDKDGTSGEYAWAAAYVNWVLNKAGLDYIKVMSPMAYAGYGNPVDFGTFKKVRKNDLIIMTSVNGLGHIGFVRAYDPKTNLVTVLGGNQAGMVKLTKVTLTRNNPNFYISHIRRNWVIPAADDVPLFQFKSSPYAMIASRPEIPTNSALSAARRDVSVGGSGAASGGTLT